MMTQSNFNPTESENSLMDYIDDGDSESELLGPVQESQGRMDRTSESHDRAQLPPSSMQQSRSNNYRNNSKLNTIIVA